MIELNFIFCTNFFASVSNGPAKFARIVAKYSEENVLLVTENADESEENVKVVPQPAWWARTTLLTQLSRSETFAFTLGQIQMSSAVPIVFNNIINTLRTTRVLPNPIIGFINDDNNLPSRQKGNFSFSSLQRRLLGKFERRAAHRVDAIIVNSNYLADKVIAEYSLLKEKVYILYKGSDIKGATFRPRVPTPEGPVRILFVKSDFRRGGLPELIAAAGRVGRRVDLHVIGPGAEEVRKAIGLKLIDAGNLKLYVHGKQAPSFVRDQLDKADLFCLPSHFEALGVSNMEAMAHGVPVVTSGAGGIPEVTDQGKNCWEITPTDPQSIADGIIATWEMPEETMAKVMRARKYVEENFSEASAYCRLVEIVTAVKRASE